MTKQTFIAILSMTLVALAGVYAGLSLYSVFGAADYPKLQVPTERMAPRTAVEVPVDSATAAVAVLEHKTPTTAIKQVVTNVEEILMHEAVVTASSVTLDVPYVSEAPEGIWSGPWINGCEEASISMVEYFYRDYPSVSVSAAKTNMQKLFDAEDAIWGSNADADAYRADYLINNYSSFNSQIVVEPSLATIKHELQEGRPVISFHYGKELNNPNVPFATYGTYYHVIVLVGYDDKTQEFIAHDNGDHRTGEFIRYSYETIMNSLADYSFARHAADGPPTVLFTSPRFAKTVSSPRVYYIADGYKHYVTSPAVFAERGWEWDAITVVKQEWLDQFLDGEDIRTQ